MKMFGPLMIAVSLISLLSMLSTSVWAQSNPVSTVVAEPSAHQVIVDSTEQLMKIIIEAKDYYEQDSGRFFQEIEAVLGSVVDFNSFARGVMGPYASKQGYMALQTKEQRAAYKARIKRFSQTFKYGLVKTYAKGLLAFDSNKIEVLPATEVPVAGESVTVVQLIYGEAEKPYEVHYRMHQNKRGQWKLRNVTIEAINLGQVYQSQFKSAARQYDGDIEKVIDNWSVDPTADSSSESSAEPAAESPSD